MKGTRLAELHQELFLPLVRRATWRHGISKEDARDVVQQAFVFAVQKLKLDVNAAGWLYRTVDLLASNHRKTILRRIRLAAKWNGCGATGLDEAPSDESDAELSD